MPLRWCVALLLCAVCHPRTACVRSRFRHSRITFRYSARVRDVYRECASVVLLRPSSVCSPDGCGTAYQVLLLRKPRKKDSWQLPQGGIEPGESLEQAALRELYEEAGLRARVIGVSDRTYQYDFPASYRRFRPDHVCGQRIRFVFAVPEGSGSGVTVDGEEITEYAWVLPEELATFLRRKAYLRLVQELVEQGRALARTAHGPVA